MSLTSLVPAWGEMPPMCEYQGCSRELLADNDHAVPLSDGRWYCRRHADMLLHPPELAPHPLELNAEEIAVAAPPPRRAPIALTLLTDDEFVVIDLLNEVHDAFMALPQADPHERNAFQTDFKHLQDRILRRAAIRAYPGRLDK